MNIFFSAAGCYLFVSHTGFGGVAYAMSITCLKLDAESRSEAKLEQSLMSTKLNPTSKENLPSRTSLEEALQMGDYSDILNLTRVLIYGPKSKSDVDIIIDRYEISIL